MTSVYFYCNYNVSCLFMFLVFCVINIANYYQPHERNMFRIEWQSSFQNFFSNRGCPGKQSRTASPPTAIVSVKSRILQCNTIIECVYSTSYAQARFADVRLFSVCLFTYAKSIKVHVDRCNDFFTYTGVI